MRLVIITSLIALSFATGFTCSKNAPTDSTATTMVETSTTMATDAAAAGGEATTTTAPANH